MNIQTKDKYEFVVIKLQSVQEKDLSAVAWETIKSFKSLIEEEKATLVWIEERLARIEERLAQMEELQFLLHSQRRDLIIPLLTVERKSKCCSLQPLHTLTLF
jgi:hypothetical protein